MPQQIIAGRYELWEELSHGGMGDVWRGYDSTLDRPVAVKMIRQQAVDTRERAEEFHKRFQREARVTARIQHPGVPQVYDAVLDGPHEQVYLVMELVDGLPLSAYITEGRPMPVSWSAAVAAQVATALSYAHEVPVIHRDLKPGNILLSQDGTVKVLDFGIAAILRTDVTKLTDTGRPIGTTQYMSPEQAHGSSRLTPQADLYALGCVLHELLTGHVVFKADSDVMRMYQHIHEDPVPLRDLRPDAPAELEELVLRLLRKTPETRPAGMQEVYERLVPFLPRPGDDEPEPEETGPDADVPDPARVFRRPYAPRGKTVDGSTRTGPARHPGTGDTPAPGLSALLRQQIEEADAHFNALVAEDRFAQAADVVGELIDPARREAGSLSPPVMALRRKRVSALLLAGEHRAALPECEALATAYARWKGVESRPARHFTMQAALCRAELGQVTEALGELQRVLQLVRKESDVSEEAVELRQIIGELLFAQRRTEEAEGVLRQLHQDLLLVHGDEHELTAEVADLLTRVRMEPRRSADG